MKIKVCGMKYPENLKNVAALDVDYLGFIFYPKSPRFMAETLLPEHLGTLPSYIKKVGVFVNEDKSKILQYADEFGLSMLQLHGSESPGICRTLKETGLKIIKAFSVDNSFNPKEIDAYQGMIDYVLLDTKSKVYGGSGQKFDWSVLSRIKTDIPIILSGGIGPKDAESIRNIKEISIFALDLNSKFETEPGKKDVVRLKQFFNDLKQL